MATVGGVRDRVLEFLAKYEERGLLVLKAAIAAAIARKREGGVKLGDFSYRDIVVRLRAQGISYNPSMLLRILERDYGVIETSYRSGNQHWWKFVDFDSVVEAVEAYEKGDDAIGALKEDDEEIGLESDPRVELVRVQVAALRPRKLLKTLRVLAAKKRLTSRDVKVFQDLAFNVLPKLVHVLEKAREYEEELVEEIALLEKVLRLAVKIARKMLVEEKMESEAVEALEAIAKSL
ncbi:MAG TPA: hypothetical protein EYP08_01460 [Pyrodictiaceae archaeon]|nr:hypothetical protein [Pyrodictiaceae archaeon]